ncbi:ATP-binding protein [Marinobacter litoralis]|uniref:ATP-binding protein n=1 Tax=Marinobacter litoralis TaxID=187981 RepID=UPI0018EA5349|nr:ATP-binding protein [Marinobacter litoralis]MBJ6138307.1 ATP-binding protein [Marinobacter litoralis]
MSLKFLLKAYAQVVAVAAVVVLLCVFLFNGLNDVRAQAWHERSLQPLMEWLAKVPDPAEQYHWMPALFGMKTGDHRDFPLSPVVRERLSYGQVVAEPSGEGFVFYVAAESGGLVRLNLEQPYRDLARATALIVRWHLDAVPPGARADTSRRLAQTLGVQINPLQQQADLPAQTVLDRLSSSGLALLRTEQGGLSGVVRLSEGDLIAVNMPEAFNPWGWPIVLLLALLVGGVLALGLYLALRFVDRHLRKVESVALRIARGEMGARVESQDGTLVSRLGLAFNGMAEHIQRLVQVQREMIHAVSHELRTPVARIRFGVQMIESASSPEALQKQMTGIDGDIQELDELIDEILTYARLEQGGPVFTLRDDSVTEIVEQVVAEQRIIREGVEIACRIDDGDGRWAQSDVEPRYIHRAVQNLVGNAARYAQGKVLVVCHMDEENCRVDVEDDGQGIPESDWEKVFTAFARLDDSRTRTSGGYGLGLSIVRRILYWHGGQAFVGRSEQLGGAKFSLVWPRRKSDQSVL